MPAAGKTKLKLHSHSTVSAGVPAPFLRARVPFEPASSPHGFKKKVGYVLWLRLWLRLFFSAKTRLRFYVTN